MKGSRLFILLSILLPVAGVAVTDSLLVATKFPKTYDDVAFVDQIDVETEGFEPYAGLSAYSTIEMEAMEDVALDEIEAALAEAGITDEYIAPDGETTAQESPLITCTAVTTDGEIKKQVCTIPPANQPVATVVTPAPQTSQKQTKPGTVPNGYCARRHPKIVAGQKIPFGLPVNTDDLDMSKLTDKSKRIVKNTNRGAFCSPYGCRPKPGTKLTRPHQGVDIGCTADFYQMPIYATADGVVEYVIHSGGNRYKSAGNYIRLKHGNGWVTQYMHLDKMFVKAGQHVSAGCLIGLMGHTGGNADQKKPSMGKDMSHLHYEIVYSGSKKQVTAPNGKTIPIERRKKCTNGRGFKSKIKPNKIMVYQ